MKGFSSSAKKPTSSKLLIAECSLVGQPFTAIMMVLKDVEEPAILGQTKAVEFYRGLPISDHLLELGSDKGSLPYELSIYLFIYLSVYLSIYVSIYLSIYLSI